MKINSLREHYQGKSGNKWIPKRPFANKQEAIDAGFLPNRWVYYTCTFCHKDHVSKLPKEEMNDY